MRKIYSLFIALLATTVFMTSCSKDPAAPQASITFENTPGADFTHSQNTNLSFNYSVFAPEKIKEIRIEKLVAGKPAEAIGGSPIKNGFTDNNQNYSGTITYPIAEANGVRVEIKITVKDRGTEKDGRSRLSSASYIFTVGQANATFSDNVGGGGTDIPTLKSAYVDVVLGDQGATEGSYYATSSNSVFLTAAACTNVSTVDITLGRGNSGKIYLISPRTRATSADFDGVNFNFGNNTCDANTRETFFAAASGIDPTTATADQVDEQSFVSTSTKFFELSVGTTVGFINDANKKGVLRVKSIADSGTGKRVTFDVVVQN